jgi:YVTN family beta-propeller protein
MAADPFSAASTSPCDLTGLTEKTVDRSCSQFYNPTKEEEVMLKRLSLLAAVVSIFLVAGCGVLPPVTPQEPTGPSTGDVGVSYRFTAVTADPQNLPLRYQFDWGDGQESEWSQYAPSGEPVTMAHAWPAAGAYGVRVRAQNLSGRQSELSPRHVIMIGSRSGFPDTVIATIYVGGDPHHVCKLANGPYLYVANEAYDGVVVVNVDELRVVDTIMCGGVPWGITCSPDDRYVYVANHYENTVKVIRTHDNTVIATVAVGEVPYAMACTPDGHYLYVANINSDNVSVIRTSDNTVVATVSVGYGPRGLCILPNGEYVYTANIDGGATVIRTSDNTVVKTVPVSGFAHRATPSRDGRYVYISLAYSGAATVIRTSDNTVVSTLRTGSGPINGCFLPNADYAYIACADAGVLTVINTADNTVAGTIHVGDGCWAPATSGSGDRVYTIDRYAQTVSVLAHR